MLSKISEEMLKSIVIISILLVLLLYPEYSNMLPVHHLLIWVNFQLKFQLPAYFISICTYNCSKGINSIVLCFNLWVEKD